VVSVATATDAFGPHGLGSEYWDRFDAHADDAQQIAPVTSIATHGATLRSSCLYS
jgi:hypothetical protein